MNSPELHRQQRSISSFFSCYLCFGQFRPGGYNGHVNDLWL